MGLRDHLFTVALIKGAVEVNDSYTHFGSILGVREHVARAAETGLMYADGNVTRDGVRFYEQRGLRHPPPGRAYLWPEGPELTSALQDLESRCATESAP